MKQLSRPRPAVVGVLAAIVMVAAWYRLLWSPAGAAIARAHENARSATSALFTAEQRLGHLHRLSARSGQLDALDAAMTAAVPGQDEIDTFLVALNADAQKAGVTVSSVGLASNGPAGATGTIPVRLAVTGGYFSIQQFFGELRDGPRLVVIDTVSLSGAGGAPGAAVQASNGTLLSASITAHIFVSKSGPSAAVHPTASTPSRPGTGVLETPINAARSTASSASSAAAAHAGGTP